MFHCTWAVPYRTLHWLMKLTELEMADATLNNGSWNLLKAFKCLDHFWH